MSLPTSLRKGGDMKEVPYYLWEKQTNRTWRVVSLVERRGMADNPIKDMSREVGGAVTLGLEGHQKKFELDDVEKDSSGGIHRGMM